MEETKSVWTKPRKVRGVGKDSSKSPSSAKRCSHCGKRRRTNNHICPVASKRK